MHLKENFPTSFIYLYLVKKKFLIEFFVSQHFRHIWAEKMRKWEMIKGVVRLIRAKKSIFFIIFFKDTINIYLLV